MARALLWSLAGSSVATIMIGVLLAGTTWAAPTIQMHDTSVASVTMFGHRVTARLEISSAPPAQQHPALIEKTGRVTPAVQPVSTLSCVVVP